MPVQYPPLPLSLGENPVCEPGNKNGTKEIMTLVNEMTGIGRGRSSGNCLPAQIALNVEKEKRFFYFLRIWSNRIDPMSPAMITGSEIGDCVVGSGVGWTGFIVI